MDKDQDIKTLDEIAFLDYLYNINLLTDSPGRSFSNFKPKNPDFWLKHAQKLCGGTFQQTLIENVFNNLENEPFFTPENLKIAVKYQLILQQAFKDRILSLQKDNININKHLIPYDSKNTDHVFQITLAARSFSYEVFLYFQSEYDKKVVQQKLSIDELQKKAAIKKEFMKVMLAAKAIIEANSTANAESDLEDLNLEPAYVEPKKNLWDKFDAYINVSLDSGNMRFKDPNDTDESLLVQSLQSIVTTDDFKELGQDLAIDSLVVELNKTENANKKRILLSACSKIKKEQKKLFGRSKEAKTLSKSPLLNSCFQSLFVKLSNSITIQSQSNLTQNTNEIEQSDEDMQSDKESHTEMSNIDDDSREEPGQPSDEVLSNNEILQAIWKNTWKDKIPKSRMGRFLKAMGPSSAKEDITSVLSSPLSKSRFEKLTYLIDNLNESSDYTQLIIRMKEFMDNPFINRSNLPEKSYLGLKKFQMVLDYFAFSKLFDAQKNNFIENQPVKSPRLLKEYSKEATKNFDAESLESVTLTPRKEEGDAKPQPNQIFPLEQLLKDIREQVEIFLIHSKNNQKGKERHTGLRFIDNFSQKNPAATSTETDFALYYAQVRAIGDSRLGESSFFKDLFKKRLGRDPLVQELYVAFKQTALTRLNDQNQLEINEKSLKALLEKLIILNEKIYDPKYDPKKDTQLERHSETAQQP